MPACFVYLPLLAWAIIPMQWEFYIFNHMKISPWRIYLLFSSLLNGLNFIFLYQMPESPKFLLSMNRKAETINVLRKMYSVNMNCDKQVTSSALLWSRQLPLLYIDFEKTKEKSKPQIRLFKSRCIQWMIWWSNIPELLYRKCTEFMAYWNWYGIKHGPYFSDQTS